MPADIESVVARLQKGYFTEITVSTTDSCPLKCRHCVVSADSNASDMSGTILSSLKNVIASCGDLRHVSVTGGEPFYRMEILCALAEACLDRGITLGVVTSAYWATSVRHATDLLLKLPALKKLSISTDAFHQEFVPLRYVLNAIQAAKVADLQVSVKTVRVSDEPGNEQEWMKLVQRELEPEAISTQDLVPYGRAARLNQLDHSDKIFRTISIPCLSRSPLLTTNGRLKPCCNLLGLDDGTEAFFDQFQASFSTDSLHNYLYENWVLHFIRIWGVLDLVQTYGLLGEKEVRQWENSGRSACELCRRVFSDCTLFDTLSRLNASLSLQLHVSHALMSTLGDDRLVRQLQDAVSNEVTA